MFQHTWIWFALLAVPLGAAGGLVSAQKSADLRPSPSALGFFCPLTGEELPCERCCPLNQNMRSVTSAEALRNGTQRVNADGSVCPINGEELPCPLCCPLQQTK